ncbi:restriction endonuclease subunit S [Pontibacter sp. BT310]|uniref:Restriction endonuclease subunit S n=1 Tax=Pontibacter populi TaxID=890055 RepID=A0ABS6XET2_9BACT|nr:MULTISPECIES: restriction endonuclease subunit S [Pontibacter]MBJ6119642.1 restriction endonuclease subunit S [Pontibacter sp. BT310]MBR0572069.1 restriction endonuclease subunit S [Microvirga sp. STS03]MBW3366495.1 restriction endonuclease subunit S [Pontibacter populi]
MRNRGCLADIAFEVRDGFIPNGDSEVLPYIGLEHIEPNSLKITSVGESSEVVSSKYKFAARDVLFGKMRPYFRKVAKPNFDGVCSTEISVIRAKEDEDSEFIFYFVANQDFIDHATTNSKGDRPRTKWEQFSKYESFVPAPNVRRKIGSLLSAYDDLIDNNLKRIALLEKSARLLYEEWFVRLRFPGYEHTTLVDGVPEGWSFGRVGDLAKVQSGFAFKSKDWQSDGNPVLKIANIDGNTIDTINCQCVHDNVAEMAVKFRLNAGDLLIAMTGATVGKIGIMPRTRQNFYLNQRVGIFKSKKVLNPTSFLFSFFNTEYAQVQILNYAGGAAQPNISGGQIEGIEMLIPNDTILKDYLDITASLFEQRLVLIEQNQKLKQARDILLPKLINGEITV